MTSDPDLFESYSSSGVVTTCTHHWRVVCGGAAERECSVLVIGSVSGGQGTRHRPLP
jgi:hypothetical protein